MKKAFLALVILGLLLIPQKASAGNNLYFSTTTHFIILVPALTAAALSDDIKNYEGVAFPLYYGIISVYPEENRLVFTKIAQPPIETLDERLRMVERNSYILISPHRRDSEVQVPVKNDDFCHALSLWADQNFILLFEASKGKKVPVNVTPRFKRICRFSVDKEPNTDCAYSMEDVENLYIPFTRNEMKRIAKDHSK